MSKSRTALRSLGVLAAASGLAIAGAGVASATTSENTVDGNTVSVTFALEGDQTSDTCGAVLVAPNALEGIMAGLELDNPTDIFAELSNTEGFTALKNGDSYQVSISGEETGTVTAEDVAGGMYLLASICLSDEMEPETELVTVGGMFDVISGLSSDGLLDTASALISGGGEGDMGAILSSALGGGETEAE